MDSCNPLLGPCRMTWDQNFHSNTNFLDKGSYQRLWKSPCFRGAGHISKTIQLKSTTNAPDKTWFQVRLQPSVLTRCRLVPGYSPLFRYPRHTDKCLYKLGMLASGHYVSLAQSLGYIVGYIGFLNRLEKFFRVNIKLHIAPAPHGG